jgi:hypothetical protein
VNFFSAFLKKKVKKKKFSPKSLFSSREEVFIDEVWRFSSTDYESCTSNECFSANQSSLHPFRKGLLWDFSTGL